MIQKDHQGFTIKQTCKAVHVFLYLNWVCSYFILPHYVTGTAELSLPSFRSYAWEMKSMIQWNLYEPLLSDYSPRPMYTFKKYI